jgi:hypothetical protein
MLSAIMSEPDFGEVMFLLALLIFLIAGFVAWVVQPRNLWALVVSLGLAAVALGWLAL